MFNYDELDALASSAKEQLKDQMKANRNGDINESEDDIYSNVLKTNENIDYDDLYNLSNSEYTEKPTPSLREYDELLFPGGPSKLDLDAWKKDWNGYDIYITEILNQTFIFRTLNRYEYKQIVAIQNIDSLQREEIICDTVVIWPKSFDWDSMAVGKAGIPSSLAEIIMAKSGFTREYSIQVL